MADPAAPYTATCTCGALIAQATGTPLRVGLCHCLDCQTHHGAPFYAAAIFAAQNVTITGTPHSYKGRATCPTCGASVYATSGTEGDTEIELHLGALAPGHGLTPDYECWTTRRQPWLAPLPGIPQYPHDRTP